MRIDLAVEKKTLGTIPAVVDAFNNAKAKTGRVHFLGLVSDGGVHSHIRHLLAFLDAAKAAGVPKAYVHFFADGRDTRPTTSGASLASTHTVRCAGRVPNRFAATDPAGGRTTVEFAKELQDYLKKIEYGSIATVVGRYYAMDRDTRWERIKVAYDAIVKGTGEATTDLIEVGGRAHAHRR